MNNRPEQAIEAYLDQLCAQLGAMPEAKRAQVREELRQHLEALVALHGEPQRVVEGALRQFGDPATIGRMLALEWEEEEWRTPMSLLQRIQKIRAAVAEERDKYPQSVPLHVMNWAQAIVVIAYIGFRGISSRLIKVVGLSLY